MLNVFDYNNFTDVMAVVKAEHKQTYLAKALNMPFQTVHTIFKDSPHLVYPNVGKWRSALKFKRPEGNYFELLCIIHAYPKNTQVKQARMLQRAFHLAGQLEAQLNPRGRAADSVIFWLNPMIAILRDMVELADFPVDEQEIPQWGASRISFIGSLGRFKREVPERIETAWKWLRELEAVVFSPERNRWEKQEPNLRMSPNLGKIMGDLTRSVFTLCLINFYKDFLAVIGTDDIVGAKQTSFSVPSASFELLNQITADFIFGDVMRKFNYLVNREDRERLRLSDPDYYAEIVEYEKQLIAKGYTIPDCGDKDVDTTVQMVLTTRKLTVLPSEKNEPSEE